MVSMGFAQQRQPLLHLLYQMHWKRVNQNTKPEWAIHWHTPRNTTLAIESCWCWTGSMMQSETLNLWSDNQSWQIIRLRVCWCPAKMTWLFNICESPASLWLFSFLRGPSLRRLRPRDPADVFNRHIFSYSLWQMMIISTDTTITHTHWLSAGLRIWVLRGHAPSHTWQPRTRVAVFAYFTGCRELFLQMSCRPWCSQILRTNISVPIVVN